MLFKWAGSENADEIDNLNRTTMTCRLTLRGHYVVTRLQMVDGLALSVDEWPHHCVTRAQKHGSQELTALAPKVRVRNTCLTEAAISTDETYTA